MKYYALSFICLILIECKPKNQIKPKPALVYPTSIQLKGISGEVARLDWEMYGGFYCGWECFPTKEDYKHILPDSYEIYIGTSKTTLKRYKTVSFKTNFTNEVFDKNQSLFVQLKAIYLSAGKEVVSNIIMLSSDRIYDSQVINVKFKGFFIDQQGERFVSNWAIVPSHLGISKAILIGRNNKNEYGAWYQDFNNNKQFWLWKNITQGKWSPNQKKVILSKLIDKKTESIYELYVFDIETFQLETIPYGGKSILGFSWSPDAKSIAFSSSDSLSNYSIFTKEIGKVGLTTLTQTDNNFPAFRAGTQSIEGFYDLKWLGDEIIFQKSISYVKGNATVGETKIFSLNPNTKILIEVPVFEDSDWNEWSLNVSPNKSKIAFVSRRSGYLAIWVKDLTNNTRYQITNQVCLPCNFTVSEWLNENELIYVTSNSNSEESVFYKAKLK